MTGFQGGLTAAQTFGTADIGPDELQAWQHRIEQKKAAIEPPPLLDVEFYPDVRLDPAFEPAPPDWRPYVPTGLVVALDAVRDFLVRFVAFSRPQAADAVTLWAAHTHAIEHADSTGYLAVTSPDKGSGKTRLLECLRLFARNRPGILIIPTASTIFRMLELDPDGPRILDELDAVFRDRSDKFEEVRAVINAGHRRGATVPRSVPIKGKWVVQHFAVFGPRVLSGIGRLPDTLADRSIPIRMLKRKRSEPVEKFREGKAARESAPIYDLLASALASNPPQGEADVPDTLPDRAADAWEPLLAVADAAGGEWPARARRAANILQADREDEESAGLRLLGDCRVVFQRRDESRIPTEQLLDALKADGEAPWANARDPLTPEGLARLLRPFGVRSRQMKVAGANLRGYLREAFEDVWDRYLSAPATHASNRYPRYLSTNEVARYRATTGVAA